MLFNGAIFYKRVLWNYSKKTKHIGIYKYFFMITFYTTNET